ncbi:MAG: tetratricopeptide repeat protein [Bacteroidales bacterium]
MGECSNNIGRIYRFLGNFPTALEYHLTALSVYKSIEDFSGIATSLINTGVVYRNLGQTEIAIRNYQEALSLSREYQDKENTVYALLSLGNIHWYDDQNDKALNYYEEALRISQEEGFEGDSPAGIINNIGNVYRNKNEFDKALSYYRQSLDISKNIGDKNLIATTLKNIGVTYKESGKLSQAIEYFNESKDIAQQIHLLRVLRETLDQLSQTYTLLADYKKALEYFIEFSKLNDSLFDKETSEKISMLQLKYAIKETEQENKIEAKDLELKISKVKNTRNIIIFITLLAISLMVVLWSRYRLKSKAHEELRLLNAELEKRVEERTKQLREENEHRRIAQEQAELANETKNRFLATISHEVRTPINAIIGFCDLTIKSDIDPEHQLNLKRVKDSSVHLLALIKDILDYSQIESGQMVLKSSTFDITKLVESVVNAFYLDAISKEIKLSLEIDHSIPKFVVGDPDALRQVLYNLIGNAVKFTDNGEVRVEVKQEKCSAGDEFARINFSIKDTGIGISKLKQKLVFLDFTQGDSTSHRKYGGAGLGLTISKYFVELMKGKIYVESEKGKGSNFVFSIELQVDKNKSDIAIFDEPPARKPFIY